MNSGDGVTVGWLGHPIFRTRTGQRLYPRRMPTFFESFPIPRNTNCWLVFQKCILPAEPSSGRCWSSIAKLPMPMVFYGHRPVVGLRSLTYPSGCSSSLATGGTHLGRYIAICSRVSTKTLQFLLPSAASSRWVILPPSGYDKSINSPSSDDGKGISQLSASAMIRAGWVVKRLDIETPLYWTYIEYRLHNSQA